MKLQRYFGSMAGRLFVVLLIGVVGSASLALGAADMRRQADLQRIHLERLADRVQDFISVARTAPEPLRVRLTQNGVPGLYPASGEERVLGPDSELSDQLTRRLGVPAAAEHIDPATCFAKPVIRSSYSQMRCWMITAPLARGGPAMRLTMISPRADDFHLTDFDPVYLSVLIFGVAVLAFFAARMAAAPLRDLSTAAQNLGGDLDGQPLPERGPYEVREAIAAFNTLKAKLREHVAERTKILASITHDLQTPLTRLRLRLEKVEDPALRSRLIDDLSGMQILIREGLDFSRGNQIDEPFAPVALDSLLESLVEDAAEQGRPVTLIQRSGHDVEARPRALQRCLANLMDNAVKYGGSAEISAHVVDGGLEIRIRDHGPGIPQDQVAHAFEPFVRLAAPNLSGPGGAGLGLTIARMLAEKNEAELTLANHPQGGLLATLILRRGLTPNDAGTIGAAEPEPAIH